jgi:hypothetical protein
MEALRLNRQGAQTMAGTNVRKLLFTFVVVGEEHVGTFKNAFPHDEFSGDGIQNALRFSEEPRLEQLGYYVDWIHQRLVLTGVANAQGLIEVTPEGQPQLVVLEPGGEAIRGFVASVMEKAGLEAAPCTWVVLPLDELGGGFGTLHIKGMAGVSGG